MFIGAHQSISGGIFKSIIRAIDDKCESLQIFVKNANRWYCKPLDLKVKERFLELAKSFGFNKICVHSSYLINLASNDSNLWYKSIKAVKEELEICDQLKIPYYIVHPGFFRDSSLEEGINRIIKAIEIIYSENLFNADILLETTAGQGTSIGYKLEQLYEIISSSRFENKLGICLDTCHMYAAGYDIINEYDNIFSKVVKLFDSKCKVIHINDTIVSCGSKKDRHEKILEGDLGRDFFRKLINDKRFSYTLGILETEKDVNSSYRNQINRLYKLRGLYV
ncbi:MAG: deoxyribonuclease IV [Deferribacterota bacterium]|nr:deoxyribonuclease IV [Deferribacterota bacterium]